MKHQGIQILETKRLQLRPFVIEDAQDMFENWANDAEVTKFLRWPPHGDVSVTQAVLKDWINQYAQAHYYQWGIVLDDQVIGSIGVNEVYDDVEMVTIGYCVGREFWHQGITSEAFLKIIDFLFDDVQVNRIAAYHDARNENSGKVMLKCGMQYEGLMRQADINNLGICDKVCYGILKSDKKNNKNIRKGYDYRSISL